MKTLTNFFLLFAILICMVNCEKDLSPLNPDGENIDTNNINLPTGVLFNADYKVAKEEVLRNIPEPYINKARKKLHIAYQHTSHGTHVSYGMFGLPDYKPGDHALFAITDDGPQNGKLDFRDYAIGKYARPGEDASDLSRNETAFIGATRRFLDDPKNAEINVVMWAWCEITGHDVEKNYLKGMQALIDEYSIGGSKIGTEEGQRETAVTFIFMTGYANGRDNVGEGKPKNQARLIVDFCTQNKQFCIDYYSIDAHSMEDKYYEDADADGQSEEYDGNFYRDWQKNAVLGKDYYENKKTPGGTVSYGGHNTQHITANRKAYATWWVLARIAGWDGAFK